MNQDRSAEIRQRLCDSTLGKEIGGSKIIDIEVARIDETNEYSVGLIFDKPIRDFYS